MKDRYDFFYDYFDTTEKRNKKGEMMTNIGNLLLKSGYSTFKITSNYEYRPDKIAYKFYKNASLSWVLMYANNFNNGIADFITNRTIIIPSPQTVGTLLEM